MGGFSLYLLAWSLELPPDLVEYFSINLIEFLSAYITIYMLIREKGSNLCILSFTDISRALGCMYRDYFQHGQEYHDYVERALAKLLMNSESSLYSQHIKG